MCLVVVVISEELGTGIQFSDMSVTVHSICVLTVVFSISQAMPQFRNAPEVGSFVCFLTAASVWGSSSPASTYRSLSPLETLLNNNGLWWGCSGEPKISNLCWLEFTVQQNVLLKGRDLILFPFVSLLPGTDLLSSKPHHTFLNRSIYWDFLEKITWESDYHRPFHWKIAWRIKQRLFQNCDTFIPFHVTFYLSLVSSCSV